MDMGTDMKKSRKPATVGQMTRALALGALMAGASLGLWACAFSDEGATEEGGGILVQVTDSSKVNLSFDDIDQTVFVDSGEFDLDAIRDEINKKGIDLESVKISSLLVTYDDTTKKFLSDNKGLEYNLKIYTKEKSDTGAAKLTLESTGKEKGDTTLVLDPESVKFTLGSELAAIPEGFHDLLAAIQNTDMHKVFVKAQLTVLEKLKATGKLNLNMVVTVAGKV
jgi:hypothetical protein